MNLKNAVVVVEDNVKMIKLTDGTLMTMDEFWDKTRKENTSIFQMEPKELKYFNILTEDEQLDYLKKYGNYNPDKSNGFVIFGTPAAD